MPSLSLITICYDSARTLRRTVQSVLSQTRLPEEYVFVDGGSTDGTLELLTELCGELRQAGVEARVMAQERHEGEAGIPSAWNQGIGQVRGEVIGLLNSDDWYGPQALAAVEREAQAHPEAGLIAGAVRMMSAAGGEERIFRPGSLRQLPWRMALPHPGLFVRRCVYERIGLYDARYRISADYDFVWRCYNARLEPVVCDEVLTNMELGGLANRSRRLARCETWKIACRHHWNLLTPSLAWLLRTLTGR